MQQKVLEAIASSSIGDDPLGDEDWSFVANEREMGLAYWVAAGSPVYYRPFTTYQAWKWIAGTRYGNVELVVRKP